MKAAATLLCLTVYSLVSIGSGYADDPQSLQLTYQPWTKFCIARAGCYVGVDARGQCQPSGGAIVIASQIGEPVSLSATFNTKSGLNDGIRLRLDDGPPIALPPLRCSQSACTGRRDIDNEVIAQIKRAQTITIEASETTGRELSLSFPLANFSRVFDGPGREPEVYEEVKGRSGHDRPAELSTPTCEN